jgi:hypothetical protein
MEMQSNSRRDSLEAKIMEWLDRQGYPLEMYTAKCCRDSGFAAYPSSYFQDTQSGQQRETDVYAHTRRIPVTDKGREFQLSFAFECKQSRAKPWVAFTHTDERNTMHPKAAMAQRIVPEYAFSWWRNLVKKADQNDLYPFGYANPLAHSLVRVSFERSNEDAAYAALMSVTKAAIGIADWLDLGSSAGGDNQLFYTVVSPILVLDTPLFSCHLNDRNEISIASIDRCTLQWSNQVSQTSASTIIEIVTKQALPTFLNDAKITLSRIEQLALS